MVEKLLCPKPPYIKLSGETLEASAIRAGLKLIANPFPQPKPIQLRICKSPGGSTSMERMNHERIACAHQAGVRYHPTKASAASMASVSLHAGQKPERMAKGSRLMIHRPWVGGISGESADLRRSRETFLDSLERDLVAAYSRLTGLAEDRIKEMMAAETWMDPPDEAKGLGFATAIYPVRSGECDSG